MTTLRPLSGLRVIDSVEGPLAPITRYLAELGARVDRVVASTNTSVDIAANAGKRRIDRSQPGALLAEVDLIVVSPDSPIDLDELLAANPALVIMTASPFGIGSKLSDWKASDAVLHALSGSLSRSGIRGRAPLVPPGSLAWQCACVDAAYIALEAVFLALRTGLGAKIDFAALDGAMRALDPGFGINGSATMGRPAHLLSRDRPAKGTQYPIFPCLDGEVRVCLLAPRQWQGMFRWMGEPEAFADPEFSKLSVRQQSDKLQAALAAFFLSRGRSDLEREGQQHGVPIAGLLSFEEFVASDHVAVRGAFVDLPLDPGRNVTLPNGVIVVDGERMGPTRDLADPPGHVSRLETVRRPFEGYKVLDLGVIVVGAEAGRLFGDAGADVVKVESAAFPDGSRQSYLPYGLSASFAAGHRNRRSLGLDLKSPEGRSLFLKLVGEADVLFSNFKPGTMESLGLGPDALKQINARLIISESSAFGQTGPWSKRLGYGPLVRAATGLTGLWRYEDDPVSYSDAVTVYPDHVAGRISALGALALLYRRERTGFGGFCSISQAEVMAAHFGDHLARTAAPDPSFETEDFVLPAAGDDAWCVVSVEGEPSWRALADLFGTSGDRSTMTHELKRWVIERSPADAAGSLQAAGIAAAPMLRISELVDFPYFRERRVFREDVHPHLADPVVSFAPVWADGRAPRPAPLMGEQSAEILIDWLGLEQTDIATLERKGIIQPVSPRELEAVAAHLSVERRTPNGTGQRS